MDGFLFGLIVGLVAGGAIVWLYRSKIEAVGEVAQKVKEDVAGK